MAPKSDATWGIGLEHEVAPAVQDHDGTWRLLDVDAFDASSSTSAKRGLLELVPGQRVMLDVSFKGQSRRPTADRATVFSSRVSVKVVAENGVVLRADGSMYAGVRGETASHETDCTNVAKRVWNAINAFGMKRVSIAVYASQAWADVVLRDSGCENALVVTGARDNGVIDKIRIALFKSTCHVTWSKRDAGVHAEYDLDSGFIEVRSDRHERATVKSVVAEVLSEEKRVLARAKEVARATGGEPNTVGFLPYGQRVTNVGNDFPFTSYAGSFHVWITLPHALGPAFDHAAFVRAHSRLLTVFQWLEPLLIACMPGDPRAPGSNQGVSRATMRSRENALSGYGVSRIDAAPTQRSVMCYSSLKALEDMEQPKIVATDEILMTVQGGATLNVLNCQRQGRYNRVSNYDVGDEYIEVDDSRVDWTMGSGFVMHQNGVDARFDTCWLCRDADRGVAREPDSYVFVKHEGKVHIAFAKMVKDPSSPVKRKVFTLDETCVRFVGLEFRVFDHMPDGAAVVAGIVALTAASADALKESPKHAPEDGHWMKQMLDGLSYGSRSPVDRTYWRKVCEAFALKAPGTPKSAYAALNALLASAFKAHSGRDVAKKFGVKTAPVFPDINLAVHMAGVRSKCVNSEAIAERVAAAKDENFTDAAIRKHLGPLWMADRFALRASLGVSDASKPKTRR
jgi:hypothetical protein